MAKLSRLRATNREISSCWGVVGMKAVVVKGNLVIEQLCVLTVLVNVNYTFVKVA